MSIKVSELAYCRMSVPDLDLEEQFLTDFGLLPAFREEKRRFFRATEPWPYCYVVEEGPEHFLGWGFHAKSHSDLIALSEAEDRPVEAIDGPGGGWRVRLQEPNGYDVDVVHGIDPAEPIRVERHEMNTGARPLRRAGELLRLKRGEPTPVKRLAHVVIASPKACETIEWLRSKLGMISSDDVVAGPDKALIGSFIRVDDGDAYVDHHAVFVIASPVAGLQHLSFEAQDLDGVMADHHYLKSLGRYQHMWGIGRHLLGSQIFDYWADPFGYPHEHWTDSDRLNASIPTETWDVRDGLVNQWGEEPPERFRTAVKP